MSNRTPFVARTASWSRTMAAGIIPLALLMASPAGLAGADRQPAVDAFANPPAAAKPWCIWWWLNGRASRKGITRDLEEMSKQGISGVELFDADTGGPGVPTGPVFMGPEWRELFRFAVSEAGRLGITLTANMCRGWNAGGPWVTPEHGIKEIAYSASRAKGPGRIAITLSSPAGRSSHYRDIAVLACQATAPETKTGSKLKKHEANAIAEVWQLDKIVDLTTCMDAKGQLAWDAPAGDWSILRIGYRANGKRVVKSNGPSAGLEIDPMSAEAMDLHFAETGAKMIEDAGPLAGKTFQYLMIDSWEIRQPNWTAKMPAEFLKRRGYDLTTWLPALCDRQVGSTADSDTFLQDFRVTVCDLIAENYYGRLDELARKGGLRGTHSEAGGPIGAPHTFWLDALKFHGVTTIPMGEFWIQRFNGAEVSYGRNHTIKQASSAAHIYGKELCMAEAFTAYSDVFVSDPCKIKGAGDLAFCDGLTQLVFHQWIHQPDPEMIPGYWSRARGVTDIGTKFGHTRVWWPMASGWLSYLARCQTLLRQGRFVGDFAYLLDERIPSYLDVRSRLDPRCPDGFDYDALNAEVLLTRASAKEGRLHLDSGMSYRYLVLPPAPDAILSPATRRKIRELADAGVQVLGPGYRQGSLDATVRTDGLAPDIAFRNATPKADYATIHRRDAETDTYFISNQADVEVHADVAFRVAGRQPEHWDPVTGTVRDLPEWTEESGCALVPMAFAPKESAFIVFRRKARPTRTESARNFPELEDIMRLSGPWQVRFDPAWGGPASIIFDELVDWTRRPEDGIRHYSGLATYHIAFDLPGPAFGNRRMHLDLGSVNCIARVTLNGKDLGDVWTAPWRVDITEAVKPKANQLAIAVANHWINRIIGDGRLPPDKRFTRTNVEAKGRTLQPAGLVGPVRIVEALIREDRLSHVK